MTDLARFSNVPIATILCARFMRSKTWFMNEWFSPNTGSEKATNDNWFTSGPA